MKYIYFGSGTKLKELSNLYQCDILWDGNVYCSVEHVYVSLKFIKEDRCRFMKGGDLGSFDGLLIHKNIFYSNTLSEEDVIKKISYWEKRKCIGIIAKLSGNVKNAKKLGLTFDGDNKSNKAKEMIFMRILRIKFQNEFFKNILKETNGLELIEFGKSCKRNFDSGIHEQWCGLVDNGVVYGQNKMGKLLMKVRNELL